MRERGVEDDRSFFGLSIWKGGVATEVGRPWEEHVWGVLSFMPLDVQVEVLSRQAGRRTLGEQLGLEMLLEEHTGDSEGHEAR